MGKTVEIIDLESEDWFNYLRMDIETHLELPNFFSKKDLNMYLQLTINLKSQPLLLFVTFIAN